ncbi:amino acid adenylation domain-containing protein [Chitinimonas arctica]|uniref:Amino acid adenylation domain-containing protein n=1 Tax=Chitinimonas arctica TaxID=2594795 RepID=A0A516SKQ1_9NEIS|nr:amino acid adenylation domain-containing protein [Chitinimonas arctica]QDQ28735.1 amino acid adenylation domain-containing protein [Chitinimonas arctica]
MKNSFSIITETFERMARNNPAPAIRWGKGEVLAWQTLHAKARLLARHLVHERDLKPGECVAIAMDRCPEFVIAAYAVLLAGGVYFPLDAKAPPARMASMLATARCRLAFCAETQVPGLLKAAPGLELILREQFGEIEFLPADKLSEPLPILAPTDPAYLIFTSGSTGTPKGVLVNHGALINRLVWHQDHSGMQASDTILQRTALTFDVSLWEVFLPALNGGSHYLLQPGLESFPRGIAAALEDAAINIVHFVPSLLKPVLQELQDTASEALAGLRQVYVSGEQLPPSLVDQFQQQFGSRCRLTNLYGPTEAAIDVSFYDCIEPAPLSVPIGQPLTGCELYIVDPDTLALKGAGERGEIAIGGICLAEGYYQRPDLTAKAFLVHPELGERIYLTGDLGWYEADRGFFCQGRKDTQVKLRGLRIELGEIEHHLLSHPAISEAVVCVIEDTAAEQWLVAAIVADEPLDPQLLRQFLAMQMPTYMLPARYWQAGQLPRSSSGKLDRKAIAAGMRSQFFPEMQCEA